MIIETKTIIIPDGWRHPAPGSVAAAQRSDLQLQPGVRRELLPAHDRVHRHQEQAGRLLRAAHRADPPARLRRDLYEARRAQVTAAGALNIQSTVQQYSGVSGIQLPWVALHMSYRISNTSQEVSISKLTSLSVKFGDMMLLFWQKQVLPYPGMLFLYFYHKKPLPFDYPIEITLIKWSDRRQCRGWTAWTPSSWGPAPRGWRRCTEPRVSRRRHNMPPLVICSQPLENKNKFSIMGNLSSFYFAICVWKSV